MVKMQVLFPEPQLRTLRLIARNRDTQVSELIRQAVRDWIDRQGPASADAVLEGPPVYRAGKIRIPSDGLREAAYDDSGQKT